MSTPEHHGIEDLLFATLDSPRSTPSRAFALANKRPFPRPMRGPRDRPKVIGCPLSVTCRSCGVVFSAARASALYCGSTCRQRANRAKKRGLER